MPTTKWVTGTATGDQDLYAKLIAFLTTDADLVSAGQAWTKVWNHAGGDEGGVVVRGPGLSGSDQIFVGMKLNRDVPTDAFNIELRGMTGFASGAVLLGDHVNVSPEPAYVFADTGVMTYWFIASGRHFIVIVKITTVFEAGYAGWFLPFGAPSEYPYPMFIGGSGGHFFGSSHSDSPDSWRDSVPGHTQFPWPSADDGAPFYWAPSAFLLDPSGSWITMSNTGNARQGTVGPVYTKGSRQFPSGDGASLMNPVQGFTNMINCYGGERMIFPLTLHETSPGSQTFGVLDGCYKCQGESMGAEDIITVGGINHMAVQNAFRTGFFDYWCVELGA